MKNILKKIVEWWNIYGGIILSTIIAWLFDFSKTAMDTVSSYLLLTLTCISVLTFFKITLFKKKSNGTVDKVALSQKSVKAMNTAIDPIASGEEIGEAIVETVHVMKGVGKLMEKIKVFFDKFKGYILSICITILSLVEYFGGYINQLFGGALTINGVSVIPVITLVCAVAVAAVSNNFTKEDKSKIHDLLKGDGTGDVKSSVINDLVLAEIKKTLKEDEASLKDKLKAMEIKKTDLANLEAELTSFKNTYDAKVKMFSMTPQIATEEDVKLAKEDVTNTERKIVSKKAEINNLQAEIDNLNTIINALKSQL